MDTEKCFTRRQMASGAAVLTGGALVVASTPTARANNDNTWVARRFFALLSAKDVDSWAQLWAPDARILVPYPPDGFAPSIDGRDAIVGGFRELFASFRSFDTVLTGVYPSADSDAVTVEYLVDAVLGSGARYTNTNIAVFRFRDRAITEYHDYFDPRRFQLVVDEVAASGARR